MAYFSDWPDTPERTDPDTFATKADAFMDHFNTWTSEAEAFATDMNTAKDDAETAATNAGLSETNAESAKDIVMAAVDATIYDSGTNYGAGDVVFDPGDAYAAYISQQDDNIGNTPNTDDGTYWHTVLKNSVTLDTRTSNTILGTADRGKIIDITSGTFSQTFTAAATLGDGWYCYIRNSGTGEITLDPDGTEEIDNLTTFKMYPGEMRLIQCTGTAFNSFVMKAFYTTFTSSGTFTKPPGYTTLKGFAWGGGGSGGYGGTYGRAGGCGGACVFFDFPASDFNTTETITIGAGGGARTSNAVSDPGGNTTIGSIVTAYGAGSSRGGGWLASGKPYTQYNNSSDLNGNEGFGGAYQNCRSYSGAIQDSAFGGAGGGGYDEYGNNGGGSVYGGAGGGGVYEPDNDIGIGGVSTYGGNGGNASVTGNGIDGSAPGGGGGATYSGTTSGAGARGEVRIWGII